MLGQPLYMVTPQVTGSGCRASCARVSRRPTSCSRLRRCSARRASSRSSSSSTPWPRRYEAWPIARRSRTWPRVRAPPAGSSPWTTATLDYLRRTGRSDAEIALVERYCKEQGLFRTATTPDPVFTDTLELDISTVRAEPGGAQAAARPRGAHADEGGLPQGPPRPRSRSAGSGLGPRRSEGRRRSRCGATRANCGTVPSRSPRSPAAPTPRTRR